VGWGGIGVGWVGIGGGVLSECTLFSQFFLSVLLAEFDTFFFPCFPLDGEFEKIKSAALQCHIELIKCERQTA
jgi:hypothetical protein